MFAMRASERKRSQVFRSVDAKRLGVVDPTMAEIYRALHPRREEREASRLPREDSHFISTVTAPQRKRMEKPNLNLHWTSYEEKDPDLFSTCRWLHFNLTGRTQS